MTLGKRPSLAEVTDDSGCLALKSFLSSIDPPPGTPEVPNEALLFTKHAFGDLVR